MEIVYQDKDIIVCVKPAGVLSTDEPGGVPDLVRQALGETNVRTVHRLDQTVSGLMVLARRSKAASALSQQIREGNFQKEYVAVVHGNPKEDSAQLQDLLLRNKQERKTYVVQQTGKDVQEALLTYQVLHRTDDMTRIRIQLQTGRTHQIRVQFSSRGLPLVGDKKYGLAEDGCNIALWSYRLAFFHPYSGEPMEFIMEPPAVYPWSIC